VGDFGGVFVGILVGASVGDFDGTLVGLLVAALVGNGLVGSWLRLCVATTPVAIKVNSAT
jgi:hypothetical protein